MFDCPYRHWTQRLSGQTPEVFFVQIGAMDGEFDDPLAELIAEHPDWKGLFVEPQPLEFERLVARYEGRPGLRFERTAVGTSEGQRPMFWIPPETAERHGLPEYVRALPSFQWTEHLLRFKPYVEMMTVPVTPLEPLLQRHDIERIDLFHVDAEGADWEIIQQLDVEGYGVKLINFEFIHLTPDQLQACQDFLATHEFSNVFKTRFDLLAVHDSLIGQEASPWETVAAENDE